MHVAVLLMCVTIAGADVRESISTPQALSDLLSQGMSQSPALSWKIVANGTAVETTVDRMSKGKRTFVSRLVIIPCPDRPNLILASYVPEPSDDNPPLNYVDATRFTAFVDVDRNLVVRVRNRRLLCSLPPQQEAEFVGELRLFGQPYADRIAVEPGKFGVRTAEEFLRLQFIHPPKEMKTTCKVVEFKYPHDYFDYSIETIAGDRTVRSHQTFKLDDMLMSEIAIPAEQYFAADPRVDQMKDKVE